MIELNKSYIGDDFRMLVTFYYSLLESSPMKVCQTCIDWRKFSEIDTDNKDKWTTVKKMWLVQINLSESMGNLFDTSIYGFLNIGESSLN